MYVDSADFPMTMAERKEVISDALATLKFLKSRVSELRARCEDLKLESENHDSLRCNECGELIEQGEEVTLKNSYGKLKGCYHKGCFKSVWISQQSKSNHSYPDWGK